MFKKFNLRSHLNVLSFTLVASVTEISDTLAMAAFLFTGSLGAGYQLGATLFLCSAIVIRIAVALFSRIPNAVGGPQEVGLSVIAGILATLPYSAGNPEATVATAIAVCGVTSIITGILFVAIGQFRLAHLVRLLPYPVLAGFLAGSGWLLLSGGFTMAVGDHPSIFSSPLSDILAWFGDWKKLGILLPALILAVAIWFAINWGSKATMATIAGAVALFYVTLAVTGVPLETVRSLGWLPQDASNSTHGTLSLNLIQFVDWGFVLGAVPLMLTAAGLSTLSLLLTISGLSIRCRSDIEPNHELKSQGLANVLLGAFGGLTGFVTVGSTVLANKLGVSRMAAGLPASVLLLLGIVFAGPIISYMPIFVTSGLIIFAGLDLLIEWAYESRRRLPLFDWMLILLILGVIAFTGILNGILIGICLSVGMFVYNYSKLPVIRAHGSLREMRSNVDRSPEATSLLGAQGDSAEVYTLQGYLFFATAKIIVDKVRTRCEQSKEKPLRFVIMNFSNVSGCDSAAVSSFASVVNLASEHGFVLLFAGMSPQIKRLFALSQSVFIDAAMVLEFHDLDHSIEYCEEQILTEYGLSKVTGAHDAYAFFKAHFGEQRDLEAAAQLFETREMKKGDYLIRMGEAANDVFVILSGRVRVQIELPDGQVLRLRTMTPGAVVGDIAFYTRQRRTADVVLDEDSLVLRISAENMLKVEEMNGILASRIHRLMAQTLAEKLVLANNVIRLLHR